MGLSSTWDIQQLKFPPPPWNTTIDLTSWVTRRCSGNISPPRQSICEIPLPINPPPPPASFLSTPPPLQTCRNPSSSLTPSFLSTLPVSLGSPSPTFQTWQTDRQTDKRTDISVIYIYRLSKVTLKHYMYIFEKKKCLGKNEITFKVLAHIALETMQCLFTPLSASSKMVWSDNDGL